MKAIVCIQKSNNNWNIGYKDSLLFNLYDMRELLQQHTKYKICIMGRKTFEILPKELLEDRICIVLTKNKKYKPKQINNSNVILMHSKKELLEFIKKATLETTYTNDDIFILGGSEVYSEFLELCNYCIVASVNNENIKQADTRFKNLDEDFNWDCRIIQVTNINKMSLFLYENNSIKKGF